MERFPRIGFGHRVLTALLLGLGLAGSAEAKNPAIDALAESRGEAKAQPTIQNRFFLKANRIEITPFAGYDPTNSFAEVPLVGAVLAYHFSETLALEGNFSYGINTGVSGVKGLTKTLLDIAYQGDPNTTFQQPLDRYSLGLMLGARWSPVYGKINLVGEGVLNLDWYGVAGVGLVMITADTATVSEAYRACDGACDENPVSTNPDADQNGYFGGQIGFGFNFFLTQTIALRLDARGLLYYGPEPDYGNVDPATGQAIPLEQQLHGIFLTTGGISIFVPKMKSRAFNF